ncbi:hypothetical protein CROQUDRAFT_715832 [Cronartium quercuum f. sp. fusiforme G11]|uniref:Uncharacterized protein n=1 Tax=Cronartium quercuum f. sp. fusiforme G11 TaxID=708437 RepID=A0A9P6NFH9_9BASI|nr:hypothetical protein CROQUDRAFT_715832 [Cronartium quercuum f. sp. fusiforme G11]
MYKCQSYLVTGRSISEATMTWLPCARRVIHILAASSLIVIGPIDATPANSLRRSPIVESSQSPQSLSPPQTSITPGAGLLKSSGDISNVGVGVPPGTVDGQALAGLLPGGAIDGQKSTTESTETKCVGSNCQTTKCVGSNCETKTSSGESSLSNKSPTLPNGPIVNPLSDLSQLEAFMVMLKNEVDASFQAQLPKKSSCKLRKCKCSKKKGKKITESKQSAPSNSSQNGVPDKTPFPSSLPPVSPEAKKPETPFPNEPGKPESVPGFTPVVPTGTSSPEPPRKQPFPTPSGTVFEPALAKQSDPLKKPSTDPTKSPPGLVPGSASVTPLPTSPNKTDPVTEPLDTVKLTPNVTDSPKKIVPDVKIPAPGGNNTSKPTPEPSKETPTPKLKVQTAPGQSWPAWSNRKPKITLPTEVVPVNPVQTPIVESAPSPQPLPPTKEVLPVESPKPKEKGTEAPPVAPPNPKEGSVIIPDSNDQVSKGSLTRSGPSRTLMQVINVLICLTVGITIFGSPL